MIHFVSHEKTRLVAMHGALSERSTTNPNTSMMIVKRPRSVDFGALFVAHYQAIRHACLELALPGFTVVAMHIPPARWWAI
jgi:hypothetical protein